MRVSEFVAAALLAGAATLAGAHELSAPVGEVKVPPPGTYQLERILRAPSVQLLDSAGRKQSLPHLANGRVTLLSLMYTQCSDEKGCPLALFILDRVRRQLAALPEAKGKVALASVSFDPVRDTPAVMRDYAGTRSERPSSIPWHFAAPASARDLARLLEGFEQDVSRAADGRASKDLSHVLKVFLIDRDGWVREIYSTSYLVPNVVVNDVRTLLMEP
ncbi:MAG: SCO family protein [Burkholderiales bacterium]